MTHTLFFRLFRRRPARQGQVLVIFALASLVLIGALGLVLDAGYDYAKRRTLQNAADAAALKGAQNIQANATSTVTTMSSDVVTAAKQNGLRDPGVSANNTSLTCTFVDNSEASLGACGSTIPTTASGVQIRVAEQHPTFFLRALGIGTSGVAATATSHVEAMSNSAYAAGDGPFIVCGYQTALTSGGTLSLLATDGNGKAANPPQINPAARGQTFIIHGPQVATCNTQGNRFKGDNDSSANAGITIQPSGTTINYLNGNRAGPMRVAVRGVNGCNTVQTTGCVMILPLADNVAVDSGNCKCIHAVGYAAFLVTEVRANEHTGQLINPYVVLASGSETWTKTSNSGVSVIRLTR